MGKCERCGEPCKDNYTLCWPCGHPSAGAQVAPSAPANAASNDVVVLLKLLLAEQKKTNDLLAKHKLNVAHIRAAVCNDNKLQEALKTKEE